MKRRTSLLICSVVVLLATAMPDSVAFAQLDIPSAMTMIGPCRLLDTSLTGQGPGFANGETRLIDIRGKCRIPDEATGIAFNLFVFNAPAAGHLRAWPGDQLERPRGVALYFDAGARVGNMTIAALSQDPSMNEDLSVYASFPMAPMSRMRVVLDVVGFMMPIEDVFSILGRGTAVTGRIERGGQRRLPDTLSVEHGTFTADTARR